MKIEECQNISPAMVRVQLGDVRDFHGDVLVSTANPWLNMSGGVNGAIRELCPEIQNELHLHLQQIEKKSLPAGSVVRTGAGSLPFNHVIHAIAIDPFYDSSVDLIAETLKATFDMARGLSSQSIVMPMLATGYGRMSTGEFGDAFVQLFDEIDKFKSITIVVRSEECRERLNTKFSQTD